MKIELVIPTLGKIHAKLAMKLLKWKNLLGKELNVSCRIAVPIDRCRNDIVSEFMKRDADILWMIDDDIIPPDKVFLMAEKMRGGTKVCGAACWIFMKNAVQSTIYEKSGFNPEHNNTTYLPVRSEKLRPLVMQKKLVEVDATGCGCIMIHREVLEAIGPNPFTVPRTESGETITGEDIKFCERAKAKDYQLYVDTAYICDHIKDGISLAQAQDYVGLMVREALKDPEKFSSRPT